MITLDILKSLNCNAELIHRFKYGFKNGVTAPRFIESLKDSYLLHHAIINLGALLDTPKVACLILDSDTAFLYCKHVRDSLSMRNRIEDDYFKYMYCKEVKNRKSVSITITNPRVLVLMEKGVK